MPKTTVENRPLHRLSIVGCGAALLVGVGCRSSVIDRKPVGGAPATVAERDAGFLLPNEPYNKLGYRLDWRGYPVVTPGQRISSLEIYPDALVVQETGSSVTVMEPSNGATRWHSELASRLTKFAGTTRVNDPRYGNVVVAASQGEAFVLSIQTGNLLARQAFEKVVNSGVVTFGSAGVYGTATGELLCHQFTTGVKIWGVDTSGSFDFPPVAVGGGLGAVSSDGMVTFVSLPEGNMTGRNRIFSAPGAAPVSNGNAMYVAALDQSLYAFVSTGSLLWRHKTSAPLRSRPTALADVVYCTTDAGLNAFDPTTGEVRWTSKDARGEVLARRNADLLVWDGETMYQVDAARGDLMGKQTLPDVEFITFSGFENADMYVVSRTGVIAKFVTR